MASTRNGKQVPCAQCPLLACGSLCPPDPEQREWLYEFKIGEVEVAKGKQLFSQGQPPSGVFTVLRGILMRFRLLEDGRRQILNFLFPGDLVGLQGAFDDPMANAVEALTPAVLCHFPRERFFELVTTHPRLSYDVIWLAGREELALEEHLIALGQRTAAERMAYLAVWLVQRGEDTGLARDGSLEVTITQSQIADMLGLSLVHTNRTLQGLRRDGLVQWNLSRIIVPDMEAARRFAQFERDTRQRPYL